MSILSPNELYQRAVEVIRASELSAYADELISRLEFSIDIQTEDAPDEDISIGAHKIGGSPDVTPDFEWPQWNNEPLTFIAQFDLSSISPFDPKGLLPREGLLSFFSMLRPMGFEPDDSSMHGAIGVELETKGAWRVVYTLSISHLERRVSPLQNEWAAYPAQRVYDAWNSIQLPDWCEALSADGIWSANEYYGGIDDEYWDIRAKLDAFSFQPHEDQLLGYANYYQDDMRGHAAEFAGSQESYTRLLAQFSSGGEMSFAGDGNGYFFIDKNDLKSADFSRSYFGLQR